MNTTRFASLARMMAAGGTRRRLVKGLAVLGLGGIAVRPTSGRAATWGDCGPVKCPPDYDLQCYHDAQTLECIGCKCVKPSSGGITGGGLVSLDGGGEADLSLFGTRIPDPAGSGLDLVLGHLRWVDPLWEGAGLQLESFQIVGYGPMEGVEGGRELRGWLQTSAIDAALPFFLRAVAGGGAGSGQGTVSVLVGDAVPAEEVLNATAVPSGFSYTAQGALVSGDLSLLSLGLGLGDEAVPGTPVP